MNIPTILPDDEKQLEVLNLCKFVLTVLMAVRSPEQRQPGLAQPPLPSFEI
uniref:Uncharacterized protein n=1 Tax=Oryza sativa subsp. japonica TaxID=39947 RepID=Q6ZLD5_ORYSJ|nr:hypothetical protein [Oryza sativa Japonica Group]BAD30333.1 hypothetical protein [Oryza sativa Japonica Group]